MVLAGTGVSNGREYSTEGANGELSDPKGRVSFGVTPAPFEVQQTLVDSPWGGIVTKRNLSDLMVDLRLAEAPAALARPLNEPSFCFTLNASYADSVLSVY